MGAVGARAIRGGWWGQVANSSWVVQNCFPKESGLSNVWKDHRSHPPERDRKSTLRGCKHQAQRPETVSEHRSMQTTGRTDGRNLRSSGAV